MGKDFTITIRADCERGQLFERVFGTRNVHVKSPIPRWANLPGRGKSLVYMLDLDFITGEQRARMVAHLADKFDIPADQVSAQLETHGVPILAEDCTTTVSNPQRWS